MTTDGRWWLRMATDGLGWPRIEIEIEMEIEMEIEIEIEIEMSARSHRT